VQLLESVDLLLLVKVIQAVTLELAQELTPAVAAEVQELLAESALMQ
jgi:hypothetical protein